MEKFDLSVTLWCITTWGRQCVLTTCVLAQISVNTFSSTQFFFSPKICQYMRWLSKFIDRLDLDILFNGTYNTHITLLRYMRHNFGIKMKIFPLALVNYSLGSHLLNLHMDDMSFMPSALRQFNENLHNKWLLGENRIRGQMNLTTRSTVQMNLNTVLIWYYWHYQSPRSVSRHYILLWW